MSLIRTSALLAVLCSLVFFAAGCSGSTQPTTTQQAEPEERSPATQAIAKAEETLAQEYMSGHISETQYHVGLERITQAGEEGVCQKDAEAFPNNCNPDGTVKK